jgi:hypothetical protein
MILGFKAKAYPIVVHYTRAVQRKRAVTPIISPKICLILIKKGPSRRQEVFSGRPTWQGGGEVVFQGVGEMVYCSIPSLSNELVPVPKKEKWRQYLLKLPRIITLRRQSCPPRQ